MNIRHLAAELRDEYTFHETEAPTPTPTPEAGKEETPSEPKIIGTIEDLRALAAECAVFLIGHNAEPDAVDLLEEPEIVDEIAQLVDDNMYNCVCQYMIRCVNLLPPPDDISFLRTAHKIYVQHCKFPEALALTIRLGDPELIQEDFNTPGNPLMKRQFAFLARTQTPIEWLRTPSENPDEEINIEEEFPEDLRECLSNTRMSTHFRDFGEELGVTDPKSLEDVYKAHLENTRPNTLANVDSARGNLAGTFVNVFVNAGFGNDKLMVEAEEGNSWVYRNKEHGMMSATASLGLSLLWDTDLGAQPRRQVHILIGRVHQSWCTPRDRYFEQWRAYRGGRRQGSRRRVCRRRVRATGGRRHRGPRPCVRGLAPRGPVAAAHSAYL
ncbi:hypothetical protein K438DRAFT_1799358 [Mycena galopus ATCC 62051]|nr:hypothetical protein K438DRAFT_1799358 [Mycena galopus ATCC 62051]